MAHASETVTVERPIAEVFAFLADGMNEPSWRPRVTNVGHVEGTDNGVGATFKQTMKGPGGRPFPGDYRITRQARSLSDHGSATRCGRLA